MTLKWLCLVFPPLLSAQVGGGVKIGVPLSGAFAVSAEAVTARRAAWVGGPYIEFRLPARFAVELGAIYENLRLDSEVASATASTWQFPLLLKYRFVSTRLRPFVSAGVAAYRVGGVKQVGEPIVSLPTEFRNSFVNGGGVAGGGVEVQLGIFRIAPEIRFTRWAIGGGSDRASFTLYRSRTQFLVGIGI